ncbi:MAG: hypothetical protein EB168_11620, partial [Euryarchaeota archaeon]|nr:hypothetical protein [Euryarchaeota archaeon]
MRFAKVARIEDFLPESVDWDEYIAKGYEQRVRDDIADAENAAMLDIANMHAKQIKKAGIAAEQRMVNQANNALIGDAIGAAANIGFAGAEAGWFSGGSGTETTVGLGDGFNIGKGQAGIDPIDLDSYLTSSP